MAAIQLRKAQQAFIDEQIKAGHYESAEAVIEAGLSLLRQRETKLEEVRVLIQEGLDDIAAGRVVSFENEGGLVEYIIREAAEKKN
jgi:antitoxin ParD1/3/4